LSIFLDGSFDPSCALSLVMASCETLSTRRAYGAANSSSKAWACFKSSVSKGGGQARGACLFSHMIPHIVPDLPEKQREALALNVKAPLVYTNVLVRNWRPWINLGIHEIRAPMSFFERVALDFPVSLGGYRHARDPAEPMLLHIEHVPGAPNSGLDARAQFRTGAAKLLEMTFADFEARLRDELDRMLGPGDFSSERDIAAITVNRWPHGYGYVANSLFDPDDYHKTVELARRPFGRVAIANSDSGGDAYAHLAINAGARAVRELLH
jgi:spermidine dehydrogenase